MGRWTPSCSYTYTRHAWPRDQRRLPKFMGEQRICTHSKCGITQTACAGPPRAHSDLLWYFNYPR